MTRIDDHYHREFVSALSGAAGLWGGSRNGGISRWIEPFAPLSVDPGSLQWPFPTRDCGGRSGNFAMLKTKDATRDLLADARRLICANWRQAVSFETKLSATSPLEITRGLFILERLYICTAGVGLGIFSSELQVKI